MKGLASVLFPLAVGLGTVCPAWGAPAPGATEAVQATERQYVVLRWSDEDQPWIKELKAFPGEAGADGDVAVESLFRRQMAGHDCGCKPVFDVYRAGGVLRVRVQLQRHLDANTATTLTWDGSLERALAGPILLGMAGRGIKLELQRIVPDSAGNFRVY